MGTSSIGNLSIRSPPEQQNSDTRAAQNIGTVAGRIRIILPLGTLHLLADDIAYGRRKCIVRVSSYATGQHKNHHQHCHYHTCPDGETFLLLPPVFTLRLPSRRTTAITCGRYGRYWHRHLWHRQWRGKRCLLRFCNRMERRGEALYS